MLKPLTDTVPLQPEELAEWTESLDDVLHRHGEDGVRYVIDQMRQRAWQRGIDLPAAQTTPYVNTIPRSQQPPYPGSREIERRIKSLVRWNAMAMVSRGNHESKGLGGHISTYASAATLFEVGFNHFFHARTDKHPGDFVYFQGHASPGVYSRAFLEGRLTEQNLLNFRRELRDGGGLSSYPHPWLMPHFWQFPTVSMGIGPVCSIYHARFLRYVHARGLKDTSPSHVWAFVGDGESDEPETLGALTFAAREELDNLVWVVNCNLQRLDGPVRGNGKIIQELEGIFRGAGWNVIKVIWGDDWDPLLEADVDGRLLRLLEETVDGSFQKYQAEGGAYAREHFFAQDPEVLRMVEAYSDEQLGKLRRGGHDPHKVFTAYHRAITQKNGRPTVILAKTIKGYGLGEAGEGRMTAHNQKSLDLDEMKQFRARFHIPISDEQMEKNPFFKPPENSEEMRYLRQQRERLGGYLPARADLAGPTTVPTLDSFDKFMKGSGAGKESSTTQAYVTMLQGLVRDKNIGKYVVPIIPDEARTFGMEGLFRAVGIYAHTGQLYEPVDAAQLLFYRESKDGQILEEGINEVGAMASFIAAGTAYANIGVPMIPFYIYYSMFGFQRVGDMIWAAADSRARGFLLGATAGRTTLNGEGLQHEDGHSHLVASTVPTCVAYDPAYAYELVTILQDGLRRMYQNQEDLIYYITLYNESYEMPAAPERAGIVEGILRGMYLYREGSGSSRAGSRPQIFGSGTIFREALKAQELLADKFGIVSDVWSVTSYRELRREAQACERWNMLHPQQPPRLSYLQQILGGRTGPYISVSDFMKQVGEMIGRYVPNPLRYVPLGTDGFGRSETRASLRRHFEVDAAHIAFATISDLVRHRELDPRIADEAVHTLGINPEKIDPTIA